MDEPTQYTIREQENFERLKVMMNLVLPKKESTTVFCKQCGRPIVYDGIRVDVEHPKDCEDCEHWNDLK